jgi:hypothetical protein
MIAKLMASLAAPRARLALGLIAAIVLVHVRVPMGAHPVPIAVLVLAAELAVCALLALAIVQKLTAEPVWRPA